jgi:hypothetical protein
MSKIEVDAIDKQSGSTLTLGGSGTAVTLASGATQTGFGRTGTVDWQTTKKTADFTAVNGEGYFVDTGGGAVIATLPASPAAGNIVYIKDYDGNFSTAACTVARNGSNIRGATNNTLLEKDNAGAVFIYVDATEGWQVFFDGSDADASQTYISASGGTETTSGDFKIHTFTGPGTFTVSCVAESAANNIVSYMVVAGGGGGGTGYPGEYAGGGGGAGGYRELVSPSSPYSGSPTQGYCTPGNRITVSAQGYPIVVGGGGNGGATPGNKGSTGSVSSGLSISSSGGGGGGQGNPPSYPGVAGGSGGGSSGEGGAAGAAGNTPAVTPAQGTAGGPGSIGGPTYAAGGGGGATGAGNTNGTGGVGATSSINGTPTARAGGGGGGGSYGTPQTGGYGGGGSAPTGSLAGAGQGGTCGGPSPAREGTAATANTGSGGGGGRNNVDVAGGNGGSGIVIIRYKFQ